MRSRADLHAYQELAVQFVKTTPSCALWLDLGLGKSVSTLTAITDLIDRWEVARVLIIAPLRVAKKTWPDEIYAWEHTRHLDFTCLAGRSAKARKTLLQTATAAGASVWTLSTGARSPMPARSAPRSSPATWY